MQYFMDPITSINVGKQAKCAGRHVLCVLMVSNPRKPSSLPPTSRHTLSREKDSTFLPREGGSDITQPEGVGWIKRSAETSDITSCYLPTQGLDDGTQPRTSGMACCSHPTQERSLDHSI